MEITEEGLQKYENIYKKVLLRNQLDTRNQLKEQ